MAGRQSQESEAGQMDSGTVAHKWPKDSLSVGVCSASVAHKWPKASSNSSTRMSSEKKKVRISKISEKAKIVKRADLHHNSQEMPSDNKFCKLWIEEKKEIEKLIGSWSDFLKQCVDIE